MAQAISIYDRERERENKMESICVSVCVYIIIMKHNTQNGNKTRGLGQFQFIF